MEGKISKRRRDLLYLKQRFLFPTKHLLAKIASHLKHENKGKKIGLLVLYKDIESLEKYDDIRTMWQMVQSSCSANTQKANKVKRRSSWRFCFRPA